MNFIEIRHLKLVKTIEKTGNITKAASMLNLTQPALSHQLSDIEQKLKTPLFHRANKKMLITPAGEKLLAASDIILEEIQRVELEIGKSWKKYSYMKLAMCPTTACGWTL